MQTNKIDFKIGDYEMERFALESPHDGNVDDLMEIFKNLTADDCDKMIEEYGMSSPEQIRQLANTLEGVNKIFDMRTFGKDFLSWLGNGDGYAGTLRSGKILGGYSPFYVCNNLILWGIAKGIDYMFGVSADFYTGRENQRYVKSSVLQSELLGIADRLEKMSALIDIKQMRAFTDLKKKSFVMYGNEIDIEKVCSNLKCDIRDALNLIFCYGDKGHFGDIDDFSFEEKSLTVLCLIEDSIDFGEILLEMQEPKQHDYFSSDRSWEYYYEEYRMEFENVLMLLYNLRNKFRKVKTCDPENYPGWIDKWESCFDVDIIERNNFLVNQKNSRLLYKMVCFHTNIGTITEYLIKRCDKIIGKRAGDTKNKELGT